MLPPPDQFEAILERGEHAQALLDNPHFIATVNDLTSRHLAQMVAAPPGPRGADARDHAHLLQFALTEIVVELKGHVVAAEHVKHALELGDDEDEL